VGHSMGSLTTLHMAWQLAKNEPQIGELRLVLVAPALGLFDRLPRFLPLSDWVVGGRWWWWLLSPMLAFGLAVLQCTLRRLVGGGHYFWRSLLRWVVWGDAAAVMDSDVLRYQWAAIAQHWEHGLICWALSHFLCQPSTDPSVASSPLSDHDLLQTVLQQPKVCSIDVILGGRDCVIRPGMARSYLADFANVRIVEMKGLGHDPFEENADAFVEIVQRMLVQRYRELQH
jgi:pimeloyl-ACP methyl ester carboxylesterase